MATHEDTLRAAPVRWDDERPHICATSYCEACSPRYLEMREQAGLNNTAHEHAAAMAYRARRGVL